jgi:hypothetical protein
LRQRRNSITCSRECDLGFVFQLCNHAIMQSWRARLTSDTHSGWARDPDRDQYHDHSESARCAGLALVSLIPRSTVPGPCSAPKREKLRPIQSEPGSHVHLSPCRCSDVHRTPPRPEDPDELDPDPSNPDDSDDSASSTDSDADADAAPQCPGFEGDGLSLCVPRRQSTHPHQKLRPSSSLRRRRLLAASASARSRRPGSGRSR